MRLFLSLLSSLFIFSVYGKTDSTYIAPSEYKFAVSVFQGQDFISIMQRVGKKDIDYLPNTPIKTGVGLFIKNTIIDFGYGYGFNFMRDKKKGETKSFDLQFHSYGRKLVFDIYIQNYRGFYTEEGDLKLYPNLKIQQLGLFAQYVFNNKRFSYKAAFTSTERQLKSAGSLLVGLGVYSNKINSDSSFMHLEKSNFENFQFGVSAGYAYTWVINKHWFLNGSLAAGINLGSETMRKFGQSKLEVYPSFTPRLAASYSNNSWSITFSYAGNIVAMSMLENNELSAHSGSFRLAFVKRFNRFSFRKKKD